MFKNLKTKLLEKSLPLFGLADKFPTPMTNKADVLRLIQQLHPKNTDKELIRLGSKGDGGYLVSNDFENVEACFSAGVSDNSDFEVDCANMGMKVFLADKSVNGPAVHNDSFKFSKKFVGATTNDSFMTMNDWIKSSEISNDSDLILQMDIEGFEYETILSIKDDLLKRFRIITIEFHMLNQLWNKPFFSLASATFNKILQTHTCVHIHPNNANSFLKFNGIIIPYLMEISFLRNDRIISQNFATKYPHPLDCKNEVNNSDIVLPEYWFKHWKF